MIDIAFFFGLFVVGVFFLFPHYYFLVNVNGVYANICLHVGMTHTSVKESGFMSHYTLSDSRLYAFTHRIHIITTTIQV
jgi:hypothetical protein